MKSREPLRQRGARHRAEHRADAVQRNAAAAVDAFDVASGHSEDGGFDGDARGAFGFFDSAANGTYGGVEINDDALAQSF